MIVGSTLEVLLLPVFLKSFTENGSPAHFVLFFSSLFLLFLSGVLVGVNYWRKREVWYVFPEDDCLWFGRTFRFGYMLARGVFSQS